MRESAERKWEVAPTPLTHKRQKREKSSSCNTDAMCSASKAKVLCCVYIRSGEAKERWPFLPLARGERASGTRVICAESRYK